MAREKKKRKKNKRSETPYPALKTEFNLKTRTDLIDFDYLDKLKPEELAWLNKFNEEYANANLNSKDLKKNLHNTKALKKDCYDRNNARNRDIFTRTKASGELDYIEDLKVKPDPSEDWVSGEESEYLKNSDDDTD